VSEGGLKDGEWDPGFWLHGMEGCSPGELLEGKKYVSRLQSEKLQSKTRARVGGVISVAWSADAVTEGAQWYPLVRVELGELWARRALRCVLGLCRPQ
jgi:hypothetical protein